MGPRLIGKLDPRPEPDKDNNRCSQTVPGRERTWHIQTWGIREGFQEEKNLVHT